MTTGRLTLRTAGLFVRTVRHLRPEQFVHRVKLRSLRAIAQRAPKMSAGLYSWRARGASTSGGWSSDFVPLDARLPPSQHVARGLRAGSLEVLGVARPAHDWVASDAPRLWRFHQHYWEWAWSLSALPPAEAKLIYRDFVRSWASRVDLGFADAWAPYTASVRAWAWCGQYDDFIRGSELDAWFRQSLAFHMSYIRANLELDVGGNHVIKNLKALVGLAMFFDERRSLVWALQRLTDEISHQILGDGGHFERAPAYHAQVLGDLIDVHDLVGEDACEFGSVIHAMRSHLGSLQTPDGSIPLLNDGYPLSPSFINLLSLGPAAPEGLTLLPDTGLAVLRLAGWWVLVDFGPPCPDDLPAHAHADTLGFLAYEADQMIIGEAFTSTYEEGPVRQLQRSTAGHSTVEVDAESSSEVWGAFRVGRRAHATLEQTSIAENRISLRASHDGYRRLPGAPLHARTWTLSPTELRIDDTVVGDGVHHIASRFFIVGSPSFDSTVKHTAHAVEVASGWETFRPGTVLHFEANARLPWNATSVFRTTAGCAPSTGSFSRSPIA